MMDEYPTLAVRYAATAGPHRVRRNALSIMVEAAQNLGSPIHAHLHALRMLFAHCTTEA
jgi:hypothetical protein